MVMLMLMAVPLADIFVPEGGVIGDEICHHRLAARVVIVDHIDARERQHVLKPLEVLGFCHDHAPDPELNDGAGAHHAGAERGVAGDVLVGLLAAGILNGIHLAMQDRIALLHALVVAASDDFAVAHQHRADRDAAHGKPLLRLLIGGVEELAVEGSLARHRQLR